MHDLLQRLAPGQVEDAPVLHVSASYKPQTCMHDPVQSSRGFRMPTLDTASHSRAPPCCLRHDMLHASGVLFRAKLHLTNITAIDLLSLHQVLIPINSKQSIDSPLIWFVELNMTGMCINILPLSAMLFFFLLK